MKAIAKTQPGPGVSLVRRQRPSVPRAGLLVAVQAVGLCGSDLHADEWVPQYHWLAAHLPVVLGHEILATVTTVDDAAAIDLSPGDRVVVRPAATCGRCPACAAGHDQRCPRRRRMGLEVDGGLTEMLALTPDRVWKVQPQVPWSVAALVEPLTVAWHALRQARLPSPTGSLGVRAAVVGPGPIGLAVTQLLAVSGITHVTVLGTDRDTAVGNDEVARRIGATVMRSTPTPGPDLARAFTHVFLTAGSAAAVDTALKLAAPGGTVVPVALGVGQVPVDFDELVRREVSLRPSFGSAPADWDQVVALVNSGRLIDVGIISATFDLPDGLAAFEALRAGRERKICITPGRGDTC